MSPPVHGLHNYTANNSMHLLVPEPDNSLLTSSNNQGLYRSSNEEELNEAFQSVEDFDTIKVNHYHHYVENEHHNKHHKKHHHYFKLHPHLKHHPVFSQMKQHFSKNPTHGCPPLSFEQETVTSSSGKVQHKLLIYLAPGGRPIEHLFDTEEELEAVFHQIKRHHKDHLRSCHLKRESNLNNLSPLFRN